MGGHADDGGGDDNADSGDHDDGDPDLFQDVEAQGSAAIEQNVASAEQQDDLVQRRVRLDIDERQRLRADDDADNDKHRDIGNPDLLSEQPGESAERQNEPAGKQRVLGDLDGGRWFHAKTLGIVDRTASGSAAVPSW